ncbi:helix-turn-helix domain-containing protein (plasmid) [Bradyrhizobium sp. Pa8]|uniref:helix-turn-helix domain-containing protein n=1 Tax=Bradyrhizobium sp. Pa8 TaxID=3386552 RepID=UPI00403EF8DB
MPGSPFRLITSDTAIAAILNRSGKLTAHGASWTRSHVCRLRSTNGIPVYREGERAERAEVTLDEAADILRVSRTTAYRMISSGTLPARQLCGGAPWIIQLADLQRDAVCREADARRSRRPISRDPCSPSALLRQIEGFSGRRISGSS